MTRTRVAVALVAVAVAAGFILQRRYSHPAAAPIVDRPRVAPGVRLQDVIFHSAALGRDMQYRVLLPGHIQGKLPVVYLLHGGGGSFRDWTNYADTSQYAPDLILVMPQGDDSYWTNSATHPEDRYEDYVVHDLIADVEERFPAQTGRGGRAILGVSMGGYGAVKLALHHPELFSSSGGLSPALDVPRRKFSWKRVGQWRHHRSIFGAMDSDTRADNDPFVLARSADAAVLPYFYLACGEQEGLLPSNREFAALLKTRGIIHEFHAVLGGHDWNQWNAQLPAAFASLRTHLTSPPKSLDSTSLRK
jgi:putative tributyrin esterase